MANGIGVAWAGGLGLGMGAGLMYLLDPDRGRRRRADLSQELHEWSRRSAGGAHRAAAGGAVRGAQDEVLVERVRAAISRAVSHPGAIDVSAQRGKVTLSGPVLERERAEALRRARRVAGVRRIEDQLEPHATRNQVPALRGPVRRRRVRLERDVWSPGARLAAGGAGLGLALVATRRGGPLLGSAAVLAGGALATRALTNRPLSRWLDLGTDRHMIDVRHSLIIRAPRSRVFRMLSQLDRLPGLLDDVVSVQLAPDDAHRSSWTVAGPAGLAMTWEVELTRVEPDQRLAWKTLPGSQIEHTGTVELEPVGASAGATRVRVRLSYNPPGGALGRLVAGLVGAGPRRRLERDLVRIQAALEQPEVPAPV